MSDTIATDQLRSIIERVETLEEEKASVSEDIKDIYLEAKSLGFDPKVLKAIIKLRKLTKDERDEWDALLDTYMAAIGEA